MRLRSRTMLFGGAMAGVLTLTGVLFSGAGRVCSRSSRSNLRRRASRAERCPRDRGSLARDCHAKGVCDRDANWPFLSISADLLGRRDDERDNREHCVHARPA